MEKLDELDIKIIQILKEDARIKYIKIADELHIPDTTVHFRIKKLKENNIIKSFTVLLSPESFGYINGALIKIKVGDHIVKEISVARTLEMGQNFAESKNYHFGLIATAEDGTLLYGVIFTKTEEELDEFVTNLRHEPDIIDVETVKFTNVIKGNELIGFDLL